MKSNFEPEQIKYLRRDPRTKKGSSLAMTDRFDRFDKYDSLLGSSRISKKSKIDILNNKAFEKFIRKSTQKGPGFQITRPFSRSLVEAPDKGEKDGPERSVGLPTENCDQKFVLDKVADNEKPIAPKRSLKSSRVNTDNSAVNISSSRHKRLAHDNSHSFFKKSSIFSSKKCDRSERPFDSLKGSLLTNLNAKGDLKDPGPMSSNGSTIYPQMPSRVRSISCLHALQHLLDDIANHPPVRIEGVDPLSNAVPISDRSSRVFPPVLPPSTLSALLSILQELTSDSSIYSQTMSETFSLLSTAIFVTKHHLEPLSQIIIEINHKALNSLFLADLPTHYRKMTHFELIDQLFVFYLKDVRNFRSEIKDLEEEIISKFRLSTGKEHEISKLKKEINMRDSHLLGQEFSEEALRSDAGYYEGLYDQDFLARLVSADALNKYKGALQMVESSWQKEESLQKQLDELNLTLKNLQEENLLFKKKMTHWEEFRHSMEGNIQELGNAIMELKNETVEIADKFESSQGILKSSSLVIKPDISSLISQNVMNQLSSNPSSSLEKIMRKTNIKIEDLNHQLKAEKEANRLMTAQIKKLEIMNAQKVVPINENSRSSRKSIKLNLTRNKLAESQTELSINYSPSPGKNTDRGLEYGETDTLGEGELLSPSLSKKINIKSKGFLNPPYKLKPFRMESVKTERPLDPNQMKSAPLPISKSHRDIAVSNRQIEEYTDDEIELIGEESSDSETLELNDKAQVQIILEENLNPVKSSIKECSSHLSNLYEKLLTQYTIVANYQ